MQPRQRSALWPLVLLTVPLAVGATILAAVGHWTPLENTTIVQAQPTGAAAVVAARDDIAPGVIAAPRPTDFDATDQVPTITVILPPPPPPPPAAAPSQRRNSGPRGGGGSSVDYAAFCETATAKYSASSVKSLLSAANKERARLGIGPLRWSSSMASSATAWSQTMA